ncbi:MAG: zonular occludens toxin domain-containing protein [Nanoarchaeota archaeon]
MPYDIIVGRDDSDKAKFGNRGLIKLGKGFVKMGQYTSLSNPILMDVSRSHVVLVAGKRGSGKSYTLGTIAEELSNLEGETAKNIASIIFDTMGIFWTMKFENEKEKNLLNEWDLKPKKVPLKVFVPFGYYDYYVEKGIPVDESFALKVSELNAEDWILIFSLNIIDPVAVLIERTLSGFKNMGKENFDIPDIINEIEKDKTSSIPDKNAAKSLFEAAATWGVFADKTMKETEINDLVLAGKTSVIDLSVYNSVGAFNVRALVIGLLSRKLFSQRMLYRKKEEVESVRQGSDYLSYSSKREMPLIWIFIDEAHEFLPREGKTSATDALIQILREGRQPGISIVLATQQPGQIHRDVMTQSDIVISHRVTSQPDISALNEIMQTYLFDSIKQYLDDLPNLKGSAIILDDNSERIYPMRVRPRFTWHGGEAPTSIKVEKRI